jgi:hypothetical protein
MKLSPDELYVRAELAKVFPQLKINAEKVCGWGSQKWADDLLQLSVEMFLLKDIKTQLYTIKIGKLENLLTVIMNQQLKLGPTTKFYHTHRKFITSTRELYDNHKYADDFLAYQDPIEEVKSPLMECIECEMKKLKPYEQMIIRKSVMYGHKFTEIAKEYGIPSSTIARDVKRELKKLKELCKKYS